MSTTHTPTDKAGQVQEHRHCWHLRQGPTYIVVPDGHVVQQCCQCPTWRVVHADHAQELH